MSVSTQEIMAALEYIQKVGLRPYQKNQEKLIGIDSLSFYMRIPVLDLMPVVTKMAEEGLIELTGGKNHHNSGRPNMKFIRIK
jgi:hypothetical protein